MKTKYYFLALTFSVIMVSCNKEPDRAIVPGSFLFCSGTGEATKASLASDNSLYWTAGDQLAVYSYNCDEVVCQDIATLFSGEGSSTGRFAPETFSENTNWYNPEAASIDYDFYAWYPATTTVAPVSKVVSVPNVSSEQSETVGFGDYLVCWAKTETSKGLLAAGTAPSFTFTPKSALLKLTVKNSTASAITIYSIKLSADANISGEADLNLETGTLGEGSSNDITYYPMSPIVIEAGNKSWVPVNISLLPCDATSIAISLEGCDAECSENLAFSGIESGRVYSKQAIITPPVPERSVVINNSTTQTASSDVLEANRLYYGTANCLVMGADETQGTLDIRLFESADGYTRSNIISSFETAVTSARVIWAEEDLYNDTNFGIIKADLNTLILSKSSGITGNALIGIYSDTDATDANLLWSFHLWCPADATVVNVISEGSSTPFTAYKLALGQILGADCDTYMYYQWGRKDPLGRAEPSFAYISEPLHYYTTDGTVSYPGVVDNVGESENNLANARKNPTKRVKVAGSQTNDWYPGTDDISCRNDNLWNSTASTMYDPCPAGYHVAPSALWDGSSSKMNGNFTSAGLWYVLGGFGISSVVDVISGGDSGYYFSSEPRSGTYSSAVALWFNNSGKILQRQTTCPRGNLSGVRCVKE